MELWVFIFPIKWGAIWSYQEFPNHILYSIYVYIYILDMVSLVGRNELLLYDSQESAVALEHLYLQVSDLQENGGTR